MNTSDVHDIHRHQNRVNKYDSLVLHLRDVDFIAAFFVLRLLGCDACFTLFGHQYCEALSRKKTKDNCGENSNKNIVTIETLRKNINPKLKGSDSDESSCF